MSLMTTAASVPCSAGDGLDQQAESKEVSWRPEEDAALRALAALHGTESWSLISQSIPGRSNKACRVRWLNKLAPGLEQRPFTASEDKIITEARGSLGNKWAAISRLLQGRSENSVKNRWHCSLKRKRALDHEHGVSRRATKRPSIEGTASSWHNDDGSNDPMTTLTLAPPRYNMVETPVVPADPMTTLTLAPPGYNMVETPVVPADPMTTLTLAPPGYNMVDAGEYSPSAGTPRLDGVWSHWLKL